MQEPQVFTFSIDQENKGTRIDLVLSLQLEEVSRSFIQKLISRGAWWSTLLPEMRVVLWSMHSSGTARESCHP